MHGAGGGAPEGKLNGNFRHGGRTNEAMAASRYINALATLARVRSQLKINQSIEAE
jgi:hypothetical protein